MLPDIPITLSQMLNLFGPNLTVLLSINLHIFRDVVVYVPSQVDDAAGGLARGKVAIPAVLTSRTFSRRWHAGAIRHA